jgi:hypothetical protein
MIELLESPKHLVALKISGQITADDVTRAYEATNIALKENERVSFFGEIEDSLTFTWEGLYKDLSEAFGQFGKLKHYYRAAVVTDKSWLGALARVEGLVFSSIDVRVFPKSDRDKAFAWASEKPEPLPKSKTPDPAVHLIQTTNDKVFAYEVDGPIYEKDIDTAIAGLKEAFQKHEKINVLARMRTWAGFDLRSVLSDDLFKMKYKSLSKVEKYAVVGARPWMRNFLELLNPMFSANIRVFDADDEAEAWEWVGAQQALLPGKAKKA